MLFCLCPSSQKITVAKLKATKKEEIANLKATKIHRLKQGDRIGRIFVFLAIVLIRAIFENFSRSQFFIPRKKLCINFAKK
jgi:hypothetical protein